jgi:hypothetical protein
MTWRNARRITFRPVSVGKKYLAAAGQQQKQMLGRIILMCDHAISRKPLRNHGGPTQTMALLAGSPAMLAGNPNGCTDGSGQLLTTDQRGVARPSSGPCDIERTSTSPGGNQKHIIGLKDAVLNLGFLGRSLFFLGLFALWISWGYQLEPVCSLDAPRQP